MKAVAIVPGKKGVSLVERPEPKISAPDEIKLRVIQVGICGTDREEAGGGRADAPEGKSELIIGHEMFGQVAEVGENVGRVRAGDYAVFTVRRGCGECLPCRMNRSDMCWTGKYHERGIKGLDGYETEFVVDREQYVTRVPPELKSIGVLCEPLSVAEKAIDEAVRVQAARLPDAPSTPDWLYGKRCLVAGLGPIGLLAAVALRLRGATVYGLDIVDEDSPRPKWLTEVLGGHYLDGRQISADKLDDTIGGVEMLFESTGVASLEFNLLDALGKNGVYVLTGIPGGSRPLQVQGAEIIRDLVLGNQTMVGSVNAARGHFQMAVDDLTQAEARWPGSVKKLITNRFSPEKASEALLQHTDDEIKAVIEWSQP